MLQQTRIPVAIAFYEKILNQYPDIRTLAKANDSQFMALWSGIGYYRRAQNMLACARLIAKRHNGKMPVDLSSLLTLPGIGKYTAGAIRNISFGLLTPAIDGNIRRVLSRLQMSGEDLEKFFLTLGKEASSGDFFQALMELGEQICLPNPVCIDCPVRNHCKARKADQQYSFPEKKLRKRTQTFHWYLLILQSGESFFYMQNSSRPFLKQSWIFPDLLTENRLALGRVRKDFHETTGIVLRDLREAKTVDHSVTFRKLLVHIMVPVSFHLNGCRGKWLQSHQFQRYPTSSVTDKVFRALSTRG